MNVVAAKKNRTESEFKSGEYSFLFFTVYYYFFFLPLILMIILMIILISKPQ